jgi:DNA-binding NarL/FixJ family response regulator
MYADKNFINEMLKAGASAFLLKDCASTELIEAINAVKEGTLYLGPSVSGIVARMYVDSIGGVEAAGEKDTLSDREMEILKLLAEGKTNGEIALELHVSIKTIGSHRRNILHKLGLRNIVELTKYALAKGIIPTISS